MKRGLAIFLAVVLTIGAVGFIGLCLESLQGGDVPAFVKNLALVQTPSPTPMLAPTPTPTPAPTPTPLVEDPAECAAMAWDALFSYPSHEAPIRVLALLDAPGSPGDCIFQEMVQDGKLQPKGVYYANLPPETPAPSESPAEGETPMPAETPEGTPTLPLDPGTWTAQALDGVTVGLLDSIYAEAPQLAMDAYRALRAANRNDAVEVICAGITQEILDAMVEDHFSMGAAAGLYENQIRVVYAEEFQP